MGVSIDVEKLQTYHEMNWSMTMDFIRNLDWTASSGSYFYLAFLGGREIIEYILEFGVLHQLGGREGRPMKPTWIDQYPSMLELKWNLEALRT